jgi:hypothetical protein
MYVLHMYVLHMYVLHMYVLHMYVLHMYVLHMYVLHMYVLHMYVLHMYVLHMYLHTYLRTHVEVVIASVISKHVDALCLLTTARVVHDLLHFITLCCWCWKTTVNLPSWSLTFAQCFKLKRLKTLAPSDGHSTPFSC